MFKVFNRKREQLDILENPISPVITNVLGGIGELTFSVPSTYKKLELEGYIQVENDHEYVIKEIVTHGTNRDVVCMLNIEEILGKAWYSFRSQDKDLVTTAKLVLSGTPWTVVDNSTCTVKRSLLGSVTNSYNLLQMMCTLFDVEFIFDTYEKKVTFVDKVGKDAGAYFINDVNLRQLNIDTHTHKYITRVIPIGKDGLTIESINNGKNYLENTTYSNKVICGIWQSDKHTKPEDLRDDAQKFLDEMAIPYETYEVMVNDLYRLKGYNTFEYGLGDVVTLIDSETETRVKQRVIQRTYNILEPDRDTINIANKDMSFEDYYKRLQTIADMTEAVINSDGSISGGKLEDDTVTGDKIQSNSISSTLIQANAITADHIDANSINANHIQAGTILAEHIVTDAITSEHIKAGVIQSKHIDANTITSEHIQAGSISAGSGIIADGAIGNAQISSIDAGKIEAGTIDTSKVTVQGTNGHLRLKGNRLQVFDGIGNQAKERVSVGDVNGDGTTFGLRVRGKDGTTVLLDENGVTSEGITDGSITNDKVSDNANISGTKLDINSVVSQINLDGTEVIQGTKISIDGTNLGVKLSNITNKQDEDSERITQAQSQITANTNNIKLKVDSQTYNTDKTSMTNKLNKATSDIAVLQDSISLKANKTEVETVKNELGETIDNKITDAKSEIKVTTDSITQNISNNYYNKNDIDSRGYATQSQIQQTVDGLEVKVLQSGGYNLLYNGDFKRQFEHWTPNSSYWQYGANVYSPDGKCIYCDGALDTSRTVYYDGGVTLDPRVDNYTFSYWINTSSSGADGTTNPYRRVELTMYYKDGSATWHSAGNQSKYDTWEKHIINVARPSDKQFSHCTIGLWCRDTTKRVHYSAMMLEKGKMATEWSPNPNEVYDGITTIDKNGVTVRQSNISTYTEMDASSFRVSDNYGGTVAEFAQASTIPTLNSGVINANNVYANNIPNKIDYSSAKYIHVNGSTGNDNNDGTSNYPYKTVQRAIEDIGDVQNNHIIITVHNSVQGFTLRGIVGAGSIRISLNDSVVVNGEIWLHGVTSRVNITNETGSRKATLKGGIYIDDCRQVDIYGLSFRGTNSNGTNISINNTNYCAVNSCDLGGLSSRLTCAIDVRASFLWLHGCVGSNMIDVVGQYPFSHVMMARAGTSNVPDYSSGLLVNYDGAGRIQNWMGGTFVKTPSSGWNPSYTPSTKTQTWSFNKIWSDETLRGWSNRQELIQGYSSTYDTGQWTGYLQMADGMAGIKSTISGSTNLSGRVYVKRRTSSGAGTGTCCMYASDGTHIGNISMARGAGAWFTLSSSVVTKIMNGTITYFYLKNNADNINTYMKMETLGKIEITYTK